MDDKYYNFMDYEKNASNFNQTKRYEYNYGKNNKILKDIELNSEEGRELFELITDTCFDEKFDICRQWSFENIVLIKNRRFEEDFADKKTEFIDRYAMEDWFEPKIGFLTTIKMEMINRISEAGLEVKMCPYNYLGYNIAGVHISQNLDVTLNEAYDKVNYDDQVVLIVFKFMSGKSRKQLVCDDKTLISPTPKFDSHISDEPIKLADKPNEQYIKSLIYLYEFLNVNHEPMIRPRHCCPIAALIFRKVRSVNIPAPPTIQQPISTNTSSTNQWAFITEQFVNLADEEDDDDDVNANTNKQRDPLYDTKSNVNVPTRPYYDREEKFLAVAANKPNDALWRQNQQGHNPLSAGLLPNSSPMHPLPARDFNHLLPTRTITQPVSHRSSRHIDNNSEMSPYVRPESRRDQFFSYQSNGNKNAHDQDHRINPTPNKFSRRHSPPVQQRYSYESGPHRQKHAHRGTARFSYY